MLTIIIMAAAFTAFAAYLHTRGDHLTAAEAAALAILTAGVWAWFIAFRLSSGGIFADGGAIVWTVVLAAICISVIRRAHRAQATARLSPSE